MGIVISIGHIPNKLPPIRGNGTARTLNDLYALFSKGKAFERYGGCWNLFPSAFTVEDLDNAAIEIRSHLKAGFVSRLQIKKGMASQIVYENLDRGRLLNMLRCIHSLRHDLMEVNDMRKTAKEKEKSERKKRGMVKEGRLPRTVEELVEVVQYQGMDLSDTGRDSTDMSDNLIGTCERKDIIFIRKDERTGRPLIKLVDKDGHQVGIEVLLESLIKFTHPDVIKLDLPKIKKLMGEK